MTRVTMLHIGYLEPHPDNIRTEVGDISETAASIIAHGIVQPLVVIPREDKPSYFWVIAGTRRYHAAKRARLQQIPVVIRRDITTTEQVTEIMLIENYHRADLTPIDKAKAMARLRTAGRTNVQVAKAIGVSDATVSQYLALLELDQSTQDRINRRELSVAVAYQAVKQARARQRKRSGHKPQGPVWEPDYLAKTHPLARRAAAICDARDHGLRRRIGKVACGQCWETVIRQDEGVALRVASDAALEPVFREPVTVP